MPTCPSPVTRAMGTLPASDWIWRRWAKRILRSCARRRSSPVPRSQSVDTSAPPGVASLKDRMIETAPLDRKLRQYWHPAAGSAEVGERPLGVSVLDEQIVLYRAHGRVVGLKDLCIHRGTPLSRGWLDDGCLVCAYHGWGFGPDGVCVRIPALAPGQPIPRKARVPAFRVTERYGLVWVCLEE